MRITQLTRIQALEQAAARQSEADRLRAECASLRTEKDQFKVCRKDRVDACVNYLADILQGIETRLQADFRTVQEERARLQQLIDNLQSISAENERTKAEERERLEKRINELQREA